MAKTTQHRQRVGMLPGESRRRSLVVVERVSRSGEEGLTTLDNYVVSTRRLDGVWTHQIEYRGETWKLPGRVVERLQTQRAAIIAEERSRRATERALAQAEQVAQRQHEKEG